MAVSPELNLSERLAPSASAVVASSPTAASSPSAGEACRGLCRFGQSRLRRADHLSAEQAEQLTAAIRQGPAELIKSNPRRSVWRVPNTRMGPVFVKGFRPGRVLDRLATWLRGSPAEREWRLLRRLHDWGRAQRPDRDVAAEPLLLGESEPLRSPTLAEPAGNVSEWLVTREIPAGRSTAELLAELTDRAPSPTRTAALTALGRRFAEMLTVLVEAGLTATDLHLGNFLVQLGADGLPSNLVLLDLHQAGDARGFWGSLLSTADAAGAAPDGVRRAVVWLEHAVRYRLSRTDRLRLWRGFRAAAPVAGWPAPHESEAELLGGVLADADEFERAFHRRRDRRADGDGRYFQSLRLPGGWRGVALLRARPLSDLGVGRESWSATAEDWREGLADPAALRQPPTAVATLKDSPSVAVQVVRLSRPAVTAVAKSPRRKKWRSVLADLFRPSRAWRGWRLGHALLERGLPTPTPLAVLERTVPVWTILSPLAWVADSVLLTEHIADAVDLDSYLRQTWPALPVAQQSQQRSELTWKLARLLRRLHTAGFAHRDFKGSNLLVRQGPSEAVGLELLLVDMDGIAPTWQGQPAGWAASVQSLARLARASRDWPMVSDIDRLRFLRAYLADAHRGAEQLRRLWQQVRAALVGR